MKEKIRRALCLANDVHVLSKCLVKFHTIVYENSVIEVLFNNLIVTTASLSLNVFLKMNDMNDKLAIEPPYGYRSLGKTGKQSD